MIPDGVRRKGSGGGKIFFVSGVGRAVSRSSRQVETVFDVDPAGTGVCKDACRREGDRKRFV